MNDYFAIVGYLSTFVISVYFIRALILRKSRYLRMRTGTSVMGADYLYEDEEIKVSTDTSIQEKSPTTLSELHVQKLSYLFQLFDFNHNGFIQQDDFMNIADNMTIIKAATMEEEDALSIRKLMERAWVNLSGSDAGPKYKISLPQWLDFANDKIVNCGEKTYHQNINYMVKFIFRYFDDNKDNYLSIQEYMAMLVSFRAEFHTAHKSFNILDVNGDGLISMEELSIAVRDFFKSSDENSPGNWLFGDWKTPTFMKANAARFSQ